MKKMTSLIGALIVLASAGVARAGSFDVCFTGEDINYDSAERFISIAAPVYAGGTIAAQDTEIDCDQIMAPKIGTFFASGAMVSALRYADPHDAAMIQAELHIDGGAKLDIAGVVKFGTNRTYDIPVTGQAGLDAGALVTIRNLDPAASAFEVTY